MEFLVRIVVEGPDNSGKSTLIDYLAPKLGMDIHRGRGPIKDINDFRERMAQYAHNPHPTIYDRIPAVSEPIYGKFRKIGVILDQYVINEFYRSRPIIVYCRGRDLSSHIADNVGDTPDHLDLVAQNHDTICKLYDKWALQHADIMYRVMFTDMSTILSFLEERVHAEAA